MNPESKHSIEIKVNGELIELQCNEILYVEAMGDYMKIITKEKNYIVHSTLKELDNKLTDDNFRRIHRSYIVNMSKAEKIRGNHLSISGKLIPVSRFKRKEIKAFVVK